MRYCLSIIRFRCIVLVCLLFCTFIEVQAQVDRDSRLIVDTLSSTFFAGRGYVDDGVIKAAEFIRNDFDAIKLSKFGNDYFQYFRVSVNTFPGELNLKVNGKNLEPGKDFLIDPSCPSFNGELETFTIRIDKLYNDKIFESALKKSKGKFLVIDQRNYKPNKSDKDKIISNRLTYLKYDKKAENAGTIIITSEKLSWYPSAVQTKKPVVIINAPLQLNKLKTMSLDVEANWDKGYETSNVIGLVKGTEYPDSFLVVIAHFDHLGKMGKEIYFPGANDNASGIAMLLNMARYYSSNPGKYTMIFIALSAEELGLLGARYFTDHPLFDLSAIKFLVNFDLAGTGDEGIKVVNATVFPEEFEKLKTVNTQKGYLSAVQPRGEACNSDHCIFYEKKVPCFYIYTLGGIKAYHDIYDKSETLPLAEVKDFTLLMIDFFNSF